MLVGGNFFLPGTVSIDAVKTSKMLHSVQEGKLGHFAINN